MNALQAHVWLRTEFRRKMIRIVNSPKFDPDAIDVDAEIPGAVDAMFPLTDEDYINAQSADEYKIYLAFLFTLIDESEDELLNITSLLDADA